MDNSSSDIQKPVFAPASQTNAKRKVVLGFSGGLDTSYCVKYLTIEKNYEVHSVIVNTGGFSAEELATIEAHAYKLGVTTHTTVDAVKDYYDTIIKYLVFGNCLKNNTYPLSVSAERLSQALHIADHAKQLQADAVAHGSTGAGNDQVRFDMIFHIMIFSIFMTFVTNFIGIFICK